MEHYETGRSSERRFQMPKTAQLPHRSPVNDPIDRHQDPFNRDDIPCPQLSATTWLSISESRRTNYYSRSAPDDNLRGTIRLSPRSDNAALPSRPPPPYRPKARHDEESFELPPTYEQTTRSQRAIREPRDAPAARPTRQRARRFSDDLERGSVRDPWGLGERSRTAQRPRGWRKYRKQILFLIVLAALALGVGLSRTD